MNLPCSCLKYFLSTTAFQNKYSGRVKKPPPPPNCVPLWGSCKGPSAVCCDPCAFCHCRLLKTVCYCRMGYPKCWELPSWDNTRFPFIRNTKTVDYDKGLSVHYYIQIPLKTGNVLVMCSGWEPVKHYEILQEQGPKHIT